ncbi:unnamed protein product [Caenorhabditis auriculariae]|uniref:Glycosyltransferase family 92 protein n=1 Tax=Caenorhabditis auriculariae TaxID=2777116 RepID=A0A8S1HK38_9PELO|nr:unnamed protein product [Caenorhabditis auriculariae]
MLKIYYFSRDSMHKTFVTCLFLTLLCTFYVAVLYNPRGSASIEEESFEIPTSNISRASRNLNGCKIEKGNDVFTDRIPHAREHEAWLARGVSKEGNLAANLSLLGAYVYKDYIAVTITSQNLYSRKVFCRYYDCTRSEIGPAFLSKVFPESTIYCGRRPGAKFISLTHELDEEPLTPIPIMDRTFDEPPHFFSVCLAPLYGDEPKWLQLVEFIEHYKLQGATQFYIYLIDVDPYTRLLIDDYVRTGEIELVIMHDRYERPQWLFHMVEIFDCLQRSKHHSKWTAFVDIDERMNVTGYSGTIADYLRGIKDPKVASLEWRSQWVLKTGDSPAKYINEKQLRDELTFVKYTNTTAVGPVGHTQKCIIRSEMVGAMSIHWPHLYAGGRGMGMPANHGVTRHYRNVKFRVFGKNWVDGVLGFGKLTTTHLDPTYAEKLSKAVVSRVKTVYDIIPLDCKKVLSWIWQSHGTTDPCKKMN